VVTYFSYQWDDTDALIRANENELNRLRHHNSRLQVKVSRGRMLWNRLKVSGGWGAEQVGT
jgi:hypothetical protein